MKKSIDYTDSPDVVDELLEALEAKATAEAKIVELREELDSRVRAARHEVEKHGVFATSVIARGTNRSGSYLFKNMFTSVTVLEKDSLALTLGMDAFQALFRETTTVKLRKGFTEKQVRDALGDKFDLLFETSRQITPKKDFLQRKFKLVQEKPELRETCNAVEIRFSQKPQFKSQ